MIEDIESHVYQVQETVFPRPEHENGSSYDSSLKFLYTKKPFSFQVSRAETSEILFDTALAPLIFESQYVQLRTSLPENANLYGLGEHSDGFRLPQAGYRRTFWNAESPWIPRNANLYGTHPVYFDHRVSGTHGVFLLNANGMDVLVDKTADGKRFLEYRAIGGVLDFYFLAGPNPVDVSKQFAQVVGLPAMMPYWAMGFHQCKYGWPNIDHVTQVVANYSAARIPLEVVWADIDYMDAHRDFTTDPVQYPLSRIRDLVDTLHKNSQRYVQIMDPGIARTPGYGPFDRGSAQGAFLRAADGSWYRGLQWAGEVVWPDWFAPSAQDWWTDEIARFYNESSGLPIDGLWVDMNEASNMCDGISCMVDALPATQHDNGGPPSPESAFKSGLSDRNLLTPGYLISNHKGALSSGALFTNVSNADGTHQYDTHNLYGHMMAAATSLALHSLHPGKRPFVLTRSTFAGTARHAAHWFGDNASTWADYRTAIAQLLGWAGIQAFPMVGSDVCGFNNITTPELCARWATLAAFQPFFRNHADLTSPSQEFYRWDVVADAARKALETRYRLLDYLYTALWAAHTRGSPVAGPLWFAWPHDENTYGIDTQWLWGDALVVSPVTEQGSEAVDLYLPDDVFYDFWTGERIKGTASAVFVKGVGLGDIPVHIRGGSILPMRVRGGMTTSEVRSQNFTLVVAPGMCDTARGELYLDDGISLDVGNVKSEIVFSWDGGRLEATGTFGYNTDVFIESVKILGPGSRTNTGSWSLGSAFSIQF